MTNTCKTCTHRKVCGRYKATYPVGLTGCMYYRLDVDKVCSIPGCRNPVDKSGPCDECRDRFGDETVALD